MVLGVTDKSRVGHVRWSGSRALPVHKPWAEPIGYFGWCRPVARGPSIDLLAWNFSLNVGGTTEPQGTELLVSAKRTPNGTPPEASSSAKDDGDLTSLESPEERIAEPTRQSRAGAGKYPPRHPIEEQCCPRNIGIISPEKQRFWSRKWWDISALRVPEQPRSFSQGVPPRFLSSLLVQRQKIFMVCCIFQEPGFLDRSGQERENSRQS